MSKPIEEFKEKHPAFRRAELIDTWNGYEVYEVKRKNAQPGRKIGYPILVFANDEEAHSARLGEIIKYLASLPDEE